MKFLKFLYLDIWVPANFYFSVLYGQVSQVKFLGEIIISAGLIWFYFTGHVLTHKQLLLVFAVMFILGIIAGFALVKLGVPQRGNKYGNKVNNEFMQMKNDIEKIKKHLGVPDDEAEKLNI